ncbi:MAG: sialate O-acetylesterase [Planctomycetota bacterium]
MKKIIATSLFILAAIALLGLSSAAFAEDRVVHVGVRADSEHFGNEAFLAMDGNPATIWHSIWRPRDAVTELPHEIVVDLGSPYEITGFTYVPRPGSRNGRIKDYEAYLSGPKTTSLPLARHIGKPVAKGAFPEPDGENVVKFPAPVKGRYFRLRVLSNVSGEATWAGIGELTLHCEGVKFVGQSWAVARGELRLSNVIGSHMVLQRDVPPVIWGWGAKGEDVTVALDGDNKATVKVDEKGAWQATLKPVEADGKAHKLVVIQKTDEGTQTIELEDILIGDVWVGSGQSNMERCVGWADGGAKAIEEANHPTIRLLRVSRIRRETPVRDVTATWQVCSPKTVGGFSGVLYHFGRRLREDVDVPLGLIQASWGGSPIEQWVVGGPMYNGMVAPLVSFPIRGATWYQGENNVFNGDSFAYFGKQKALIEGWRKAWGTDFPFYLVQLAPCTGQYGAGYGPGQLPALWEAQVAALTIPKTGMAVTTDLVHNLGDIHPRNKKDVGERLALWALAKDYGKKDLVCSGPLYKSMKVEGNKIRISFAHTGSGLKSRDGRPLNEFQIGGADGRFVPAKATIDGATVIVEAGGIPAPTQVRFGWHKVAVPNLVNKEGLPASPFRTNGWRGGTGE